MSAFDDMADELDKASDDLNRALISASMALAALRLGVRSSVPIDSKARLSFGKNRGVWGLTIEVPGVDPIPVTNAPRGLKVLATKQLETLRQALLVDAKLCLKDVKDATEEARRFVRIVDEG